MTYPPPWRHESDPALALELMDAHPLAHLFTARDGLRSTRIPFVTDRDADAHHPVRLRGHLNAQNPQAKDLDGAPVLVAFSGHNTYVSPNWRVAPTRGGTYDFEEVTVRGTARVVEGEDRFRRLIDDLSNLIEPQYAEVADHPVWQTADAPAGYIERLLPHVIQFDVEIEELEIISKLHQQFPREDRESIAEHLERSTREGSRAIAEKIRRTL